MRNGLRRLHRFMRRLTALLALLLLFLAGSAQAAEMKILVVIKGHNLPAVLEDNPASRLLYELMPITVKMKNLYQREMSCTLPGKLPVSKLSANDCRAGDIIYMPHRQSLSIIYGKSSQRFRRQNLGHIASGAELFKNLGETDVTFAPFVESDFPKPKQ